jgi:hypothetical protein
MDATCWTLAAPARNASLLATVNPMPATLTIGNGSDMTPVTAAIQ